MSVDHNDEMVSDFEAMLKQSKLGIASVDDMTQRERIDLFCELARKLVGPQPIGDAGLAILPLCARDDVPAGATVPIVVTCQRRFKPMRLVILEPVVERATSETIDFKVMPEDERVGTETVTTTGMWWWKKTARTVYTPPTPVQSRAFVREVQTVPRGAWSVDAVYVGPNSQFESSGPIGGDAFAPDGKTDFDGTVCQPGQTITVHVRHSCVEAVPFRAVILGKLVADPAPVADKKRKSKRVSASAKKAA